MYEEDEYIDLSGIQHYVFCKRQWALIHIEQQWQENVRTAEGRIMHQHAHDSSFRERRGNLLTIRGMRVSSRNLGISGECDVVEFRLDEKGVTLFGVDGKYQPCPIEYKHGNPKDDNSDIAQLCAQALCLEEMLCCKIEKGYLYYGETKHRTEVIFSDEIRHFTKDAFEKMHELYKQKYTPKVRRTKACNACSLKNLCLPIVSNGKSASAYISEMLRWDDEENK